VEEMESLLHYHKHLVMKAPWSGAGRGLRWVHGELTHIDRNWLQKTITNQKCVVVEPRRNVSANVALEYKDSCFVGYSYFNTGRGVYKENVMWGDPEIENHFSYSDLQSTKLSVEKWLSENVFGLYKGPLGVDLMVCDDGSVYVAEINFRHTMGMIAHARIKQHKK